MKFRKHYKPKNQALPSPVYTLFFNTESQYNTYNYIQGLSERMASLKLLVLGTESTIGAKICWKISIKALARFGTILIF